MNVSEEDYRELKADNEFLRASISELQGLLKKATDSIAQHTATASRLRITINQMEEHCMKCEYHNNQPEEEK